MREGKKMSLQLGEKSTQGSKSILAAELQKSQVEVTEYI